MSRIKATTDMSHKTNLNWITSHPEFGSLGIEPGDLEGMDDTQISDIMSKLPPTMTIQHLISQIHEVKAG